MPIEEEIVAWSATRPAWQRNILKRIATGDLPSLSDFEALVDDLVAGRSFEEVTFGLEELPQTTAGDPPVRLLSIGNVEHVNALESSEPLTLEPTGITLIYGNNGSGKSGYARVLRRISRARKQEEIHTDVFRDTAVAKPTATLRVQIAELERTVAWPEEVAPELQRVLFYDEVCGAEYISTDSEFPYRPSTLFVMDGLIRACDEVGRRLDARIETNEKRAVTLPEVDPDLADSEVGVFLAELSEKSKEEDLSTILSRNDLADSALEAAKREEARLGSADHAKERQTLGRQADRLEALAVHLESMERMLGDGAFKSAGADLIHLVALEQASDHLAQNLASEPVSGAGSSPWKHLWEAARRFSQEVAYPDAVFPNVSDEANCVLCHQPLKPETRERLRGFETFVQDDTQTRLQDSNEAWERSVAGVERLQVLPDVVSADLEDLEAERAELVNEVRSLLAEWKTRQGALLEALRQRKALPSIATSNTKVLVKINAAASTARKAREDLANPEKAQTRLAEATKRRKKLELLRKARDEKATIVAEIERRTELARLRNAKNEAATTGISRKATELSAEHITEVIQDAFTRETERLDLDRVTIAKTKGIKGTILHQPKLVGTKQSVKLPRVFSEGEKTALGLAAFFTEARLDESKSALVLDDPVSSLDHVRRALVAARVAELAQDRQVIVFTHDVAFVSDLTLEAAQRGVTVVERSVTRRRNGDRRPGLCGLRHPWKAKNVAARLDALGAELARIKRENEQWDEETYEDVTSKWAGHLSQTWERIFSQEIVGVILAEGRMEVRPKMVRRLARFTEEDNQQFQASYSRVSKWANRHDKSDQVNYVSPTVKQLEDEITLLKEWFKRIKNYD